MDVLLNSASRIWNALFPSLLVLAAILTASIPARREDRLLVVVLVHSTLGCASN
jgi:hypothetical protein